MLKGKIQLSLMIGPLVPLPVPKEIMDALNDIEVTSASGEEASGFQMSFTFSSKSALNTLLLLIGQTGPFIRVIIAVTVGGTEHVLMDGLIDHQQVTPNVQTGQSVLHVSGSDLSSAMDLIEFTGLPYPCMPAEARVALAVAKYAMFGMIPVVIPSLFMDIPIPTDRIPVHQGTDLAYIRQLAGDAGYIFYVEPGPVMGTNMAYWGPEIKVGVPQKALNVNMDSFTNVEDLNFTYNAATKTIPVVFIQNQQTRAPIPIPIPDITPLNPPLGAIPGLSVQLKMMKDTVNLSPMAAIGRGLAEASRSADVVTGNGSLDVVRYGTVLKSRALVGVRGAGIAYDGLYFVKKVTHKIKRGQYKQEFTLSRNGLVSTVPAVPA
ncbi:hypothetical protein [Deminuibacter soli]|uniref:Phage late control D family protein n=1 Tax=Deminuibacter soli TaxID=2291815 RepID=A0A3E1NGM0_9BACT|nr:hypothetical protein [Deminuibacter soli]RFM26938.1 hypothetical protein DXN05_18310 [Deminuibacter soli]